MEQTPTRSKLQTKFNPWLSIAELALRYFLLILWQKGAIHSSIFWFCQLLLLPIVTFGILAFRDKRLVRKFGVSNSKDFEVKNAPGWTSYMFILCFHNAVLGAVLLSVDPPWFGHILQGFLAIAAFIYTGASVAVSSSAELATVEVVDIYQPFQDVDENDRLILRIRAELADFLRRVEAYTIESTLIGAISFTAFVTIVATDKGSNERAHALFQRLLLIERGTRNVSMLRALLQQTHYPSEQTILILVAFSALSCSLLFMGVIVARLRFSSLIGAATFSADMAGTLNSKGVGHTLDSDSERRDWLKTQVVRYFAESKVESNQLRPIIAYMTVFRNLGLMAFLGTLVLSALWFGPILAIVFLFIAIITYIYPWIDSLIRDKKLGAMEFLKLRKFIRPN